ncbi:YceH family protein [Paraglaciecola sp. 20A4]|uniref:YceH family protein n=1 Tax=Paraglaciecola sp. 20A4 TaxID=2687288 RepID=UPI0014073F12|nr:YceH family protein [Paraglaciecola sp. 20A4]
MLVTLTQNQARVIGVLLEKEVTTPEQYPLSLNSVTTACNQKSNREPVMELTDFQVQTTLDELYAKNLIFEQSGSRATRFKHRFCNTEFSDLQLTPQQLAIICVMLLRGPQTPGELRTRAQRMAGFSSVDEVDSALQQLMDLKGDQLVVRLARVPGKRESRYAQQFYKDTNELSSNESELDDLSPNTRGQGAEQNNPLTPSQTTRLTELELTVANLSEQLQILQAQVDELRS